MIADDDVDTYYKSIGESDGPFTGRTSEQKEGWLKELIKAGDIEKRFNFNFFTEGDSRNQSWQAYEERQWAPSTR